MNELTKSCGAAGLPHWVPREARHYIGHVEQGVPIRALARRSGCAASTVLRQVQRLEKMRDDPLVDSALAALGRQAGASAAKVRVMGIEMRGEKGGQDSRAATDPAALDAGALRVLRRLAEPGAVLAAGAEMETAVIVRERPDGGVTRTGTAERALAEALALNGWIEGAARGRIARYRITAAGRAELRRLLASAGEAAGKGAGGAAAAKAAGFAEAPAAFSGAPVKTPLSAGMIGEGSPARAAGSETPLQVLARRRCADGTPFLSRPQAGAGARLREDYELAMSGPGASGWDPLGGAEGGAKTTSAKAARDNADGAALPDAVRAARARVTAALHELGPGLGDVALRCCCLLEGLETTERRMGWSARSGKIVLRIALERLRRHYAETGDGDLIG